MILKIRAHHLLCTIGFRGKGYSDEFVENMKEVVNSLNKKDLEIQIVKEGDIICGSCPKLQENKNICKNEDHILEIDKKVITVLGLQIGKIYKYTDIVKMMKGNLNLKEFRYICGDCSWLDLGYCEEDLGCFLEWEKY